MAAHDGDGPQDLPSTWPFRAAFTILIGALAWFCLGFAIEDIGNELDAHLPVFWILILVTVLLLLLGTVINITRERRRKQHG
jgi:undecaprenyl pyrophosphate phosphatase UppP